MRVLPNISEYRCGFCGYPGDNGRCEKCGSGMDSVELALKKYPDKILRWLQQGDRAWREAEKMRNELSYRYKEDYEKGLDYKRFDNAPLYYETQ